MMTRSDDDLARSTAAGSPEPPTRVFISYAHEDDAHQAQVHALWILLRANGVDAILDLPAADRRQDWSLWMLRQVREADFILVVASQEYRRRGEGESPPDVGRGVQWEAALIREEVYSDRQAAQRKYLPVLLPGKSAEDVPIWLGPNTGTCYRIKEFTIAGAEELIRVLTYQPYETYTPLGQRPILPSRSPSVISAASPPAGWNDASVVAPLYRLFLHFFDPHFLDQVTRGRNADLVAGEARRATRVAVLTAQTVFVPAASYIESDLCADTVNEYRGVFDTGQITLVGGEANIVDFAVAKLLQYEPGGERFRKYEAVLSSSAATPPFWSRGRSATSDITFAWLRRLEDLSGILEGLPRASFVDLEAQWANVPELLDGQAFTPEYVAPLLFDSAPTTGPELIISRRAGSEINSAYFASYTTELSAGIVTDLTYLHSPSAGSATSIDLPFRSLLRALEWRGVIDLVLGARPERLIELRSNPDVVAAIVSCVARSTSMSEVSQHSLTLPGRDS